MDNAGKFEGIARWGSGRFASDQKTLKKEAYTEQKL